MNTWTLVTQIILVATTVNIIVYDILAVIYGKRSTISKVVLDTSLKFLFIPYACGVLMGHFFWPGREAGKKQIIALAIISVCILGYSIYGLYAKDTVTLFLKKYPIIIMQFGIVIGHFCWTQGVA